MRKERLERAKKIIKDMVQFIENVSHIGKEDIEYLDWLIQQAERAQELEQQVERVQELELEINDWREEVQKWQQFYKESEESHLETKEVLHSTVSEIKRYRKALEFYADENIYDGIEVEIDTIDSLGTPIFDLTGVLIDDNGETARKALEESE